MNFRLADVAFVAAGLLGCVGLAQAQSSKPGLWEITQKMQGGPGGAMAAQMAAAQEQMAKMPPEQRKMMEEMMAKNGVSMGGAGPGGGMTIKMCMTKEMAERNEVATQTQEGCTSNHSPRTGNTMKFSFTCTKPPSSGEGTVTFNGPNDFAMNMNIKTQVQGKPESMSMSSAGKWLGDDCGSIKPMLMPKK